MIIDMGDSVLTTIIKFNDFVQEVAVIPLVLFVIVRYITLLKRGDGTYFIPMMHA